MVAALTRAGTERGKAPRSITLDNGSEFTGRALEAWTIQDGVELCFIRPGRPDIGDSPASEEPGQIALPGVLHRVSGVR